MGLDAFRLQTLQSRHSLCKCFCKQDLEIESKLLATSETLVLCSAFDNDGDDYSTSTCHEPGTKL